MKNSFCLQLQSECAVEQKKKVLLSQRLVITSL